ncbi:LysR family transcriptional regulator [Fusibacter sp. 3D3]|uniref:LysR family transcriptional regulator n=1 Tax=Fusibacter sp. 3D3 TaxID=1048380 RepID=UPI000853ABAC|nr:LysR family transcriptional regulator [Fusibacter sp. 3D3]GAU76503.1 transcriptional regulator, LysR family [Fusibacter sp. 3D3]
MYKINFEEVLIFLTVAEHKHFSKAAQILYISQPTVTKWIIHLESELGLTLFKRNSKSVTLTPAGEQLYRQWKDLYASFHTSIKDVKLSIQAEQSTLTIGALYGFNFENTLFECISEFENQYSNIKIDFNIYPFSELNEKVNKLDVCFSTNFETENLTGFHQFLIDKIDLFLAVSKDNPLSNRPFVRPEEIKDEIFFVFSTQTSPTGLKHIEAAFKKHHITPNLVVVDNIPSQHMKILRNKGVSITNKHFIKGYEDVITLIELKDFPVELYHVCVYNPKSASKTAQLFYDFMTAYTLKKRQSTEDQRFL